MKSSTPALRALLLTRRFVMGDLYTLTTSTDVVERYTSYDLPIRWAGKVYQADGPQWSRSGYRLVVGVEVDSMEATVVAKPEHLIMGEPFLHVAHNGGLDGARLLVQRAFMPEAMALSFDAATATGVTHIFGGRLSIESLSANTVVFTVKSDLELLNVNFPRNVYQPGCLNNLYDGICGLSKADWTVSGISLAGATLNRVPSTLTQDDGYFDAGVITFTSGPNAGVARTVKRYLDGAVEVSLPFKARAASGNTFTIRPGCDKAQATCSGKFDNLTRFRGQPYVPVPETSV